MIIFGKFSSSFFFVLESKSTQTYVRNLRMHLFRTIDEFRGEKRNEGRAIKLFNDHYYACFSVSSVLLYGEIGWLNG